MDHSFQPSLTNDKECVKCKRGFRDHSTIAQCEACPAVGKCDLFCGMLLCAKCYKAEVEANAIATAEHQAPEKQEARVKEYHDTIKINQLIVESNKIDQSIQLVSDIFNAQTIAIAELAKAIDADENITNKPYARYEMAANRIKHFSKVLFDAKEAVVQAENSLRAATVFANQQISQLREEERAKLKISDFNYQPATPKTPKPKSTGTKKASTKAKIDMAEVSKWAAKINMPYNVIHMRMLKKNMSAEEATRTFAAELGLTVAD